MISPTELKLRRRHRDDFTYYAPRCLRIRPKEGKRIIPLALNKAQKYLHRRIEDQLRRTGRVRILVLKGRQQGCSTYTEGRFMWKTTHKRGMRAFILTHQDQASTNLFRMAKRYYDKLPVMFKPSISASNAKELIFNQLDSGYVISTANSKEGARSETVQYFHGSEVAFWPDDDTILGAALETVPDADGTEVILESTANGAVGAFYKMVQLALREEGDYELVFIPWFWQEEYTRPVPQGFERTAEEMTYSERCGGLSDGQLQWRRAKIITLLGVHNFRREYPCDVVEAFEAEVEGAIWTREVIENTRLPVGSKLPAMKKIVVAVDPSGGKGRKNDEQGIVVAGEGYDGHFYVFEDASCKKSPHGWGTQTVVMYEKWEGDLVVGEKNYGGDMVESTIRTVNDKIPYKGVNATRGKDVRAQPISSLYTQGIVHHVGVFSVMENEMVSWVPGNPSPNRMDALVWALTELAGPKRLTAHVIPIGVDQHDPYM